MVEQLSPCVLSHGIYHPHAGFRTSIEPCQTQVRAHLVNENELLRITLGDLAAKSRPLAVVTLAGGQALFFAPQFQFLQRAADRRAR